MAAAARTPLRLPWAALLLLAAALLHSGSPAAPEKEVPNKPLRVRVRSPGNKLSVRWKLPQASGLRNPRRPHGYLLGYGESSRKMSYVPLQKHERSQEAKKLASESVYVVSLQSRNSQGQSQPVYSAALTKRKVSEEDELEEAKDISVRVMSSQSVLVTWMDPIYEKPKKIDPTRRYAVRYREKGESARWDYKQVPNRRVLVDKLIPDTVYEFAVRISEGEKEGKWSASVYQRTPEAAPASAPENLDVWPIKGKTTSVTASWDPLAESEGKVKEYILSYAPALKPFGAKSITYRGGTTSAIIDGLQPGERYIFKIRAANRRGQGPQSKAFSVIMPTASRDDSNVHQQTNIQDNMESKKPGDDVPSSPSRTFSVPSRKIQPSASSKHTAVHSSSSPSGGDTKSPLSEFKNKLLTGSGVLSKSQLFSKKTSEREPDPQFTEVTDDQDSSIEMPTALPKTQDQRRNIGPYSPSRPFPSVLSSGRTPVRPRTPVRTRQMSTDKHGSSSSSLSQRSSSSAFSPISKYTDNETKRQRQGNSNIPSSPKIPLDNLPAENVPHDIADSVEEKQISLDSVPLKKTGSSQVSPKTPEHTRLALPLNRQSSVSRKVVQSHQTKPHISSVPVKLPTSSTVTNSQSHSRYPSSKLVHSDTLDSYDNYDDKEADSRNDRSSSSSSHDADSLPSLQTKLHSGSNPHMLKDPKLATAAASSQSAVSASASHTLTNSRIPSSAKHKYDGRDVDDGNYSEDTETEGEEKRQDFSSSRFNSRSFLGQTASEHFNLLKHKSSHTINKFPNKISSSQESKLPPSKPPYSAVSSKVHPQTNARLTSASATRSSSNIERDTREREGEDEKPLPSTIAHDHSSSSSRLSSSAAVYSRRSPSVESSVHHREPVKQKSQLPGSEDELLITEIEETPTKSGSLLTVHRSSSLPSISGRSPSSTKTNHHSSPSVSHQVTNGQFARSRALSGSSSSTGSSSVATAEKYSRVQSSTSKQQPDDQDSKEVKETFAKSKQSIPLSKKTLTGGSHFSSKKPLHSEPSSSQKAHAGQSQLPFSLLNSRGWLPSQISHKSNEKLQEDEDVAEEEEADDKINAHSAFPKDVSSSRRISTSLSQGSSSSSLSKLQQSVSQISKVDEKHKSSHDSLTSSRGSSSSLPAGRHVGSRVATSNGQVSDSYKQSSSSYQSEPSQPGSSSITDTAKDNQNSRDTSLSSKSSSTSLRQTHPSVPNYHSGSRVPTRIAFKSEKKYGPFQSQPSKVEPSPKAPFSSISKSRQSGSKDDDDGEGEVKEKPTLSSAARWSSSSNSRGSTNMNGNGARDKRKPMGSRLIHKVNSAEEKEEEEPPTSKQSLPASQGRSFSSVVSRISQTPNKPHRSSKPRLDWPGSSASISVPSQLYPTRPASPTLTSSSSPVVPHQRLQRQRNLSQRQFVRPPYRQGSNGRPNLTTKTNINGKILPGNNGKLSGQRIINGPQGTKWIVDLDRGLVLNAEGRYLQDSQGKPLRVKLGGDGRTIVDAGGAPVVSPDGLPLFGHGRFSKPLASAQDKPVVSLGGKPLIGLEMIKKTTTSSTTTTTIPPTTTTATTTTTTITTTTPEPTTTELPTEKPLPTCPPGTDAQYDEEGKLVIGPDGLPECSAEDTFSGLDMDVTPTPEAYVIYDEDFEFFESTLPPTTTMITTTTATTTTTEAVPETDYPEISVASSDPVSEFDLAGKKRFTAPYVSYLNKDPAAPCSLTEALEHFQVESLDEIIPYNLKEGELRPQTVPYNITVVAVEGCHSFVIVDWTKPRQGDLITGYLVYSASYDDFIRNKWSTKTAGATHLPIENLKPNTRYYFKVQAKNPYGYGPISSSVSFVTESDNPLLIVRPPGGEPIWIPFTFKYDPTYSDCSGKQYVKRTWYRKFVGVVLCNSLRYKIYLSDDLKDTFYGIGDSWGRGEDHCQFVDSHMDGRTGPQSYVEALPTIQGYYRQYRQEPVSFGRIGYTTPYYYVSWYECGVPIPGKW
ncbi:fibronectin type III domain-containing protein 1 [Gopherus flavomarginatus]|uniref:fibronectin type III domain-containing protein 1 n=1 Tax=Gopherus flavomarginatus TaxID=286002 RepID=UPI0021CBAB41|nr:fibronectin type III domain-containing protein 1 [Gopherus flavomarginatus]